MTAAEIRASIDRMTDEERFFAAAYLQHLAQRNDPAYQAILAARMERMDGGKKVSLDQAQRISIKRLKPRVSDGALEAGAR